MDLRIFATFAKDLNPRDNMNKFDDQSYLSITDLDKPSYATHFLDNDDYPPSKSFRVTMTKFDGTEVKG